MASNITKTFAEWQRWCRTVQERTPILPEAPAEKQARIRRARRDYNFFVEYYFPHYTDDPATGKHTACAPFQIEAANRVFRSRNYKGVEKWARGHAKSTHFDIFIPMWLKIQEPRELNVMVLVGKSEENAKTLLGDLQAELQFNRRYIADFGVQYNAGDWQEGRFVTADGCAFFARGRGQSPRGLRYRSRRPDYITIDDLDDDELCENESRVKRLTNWVKEALFGTLDGGRGRFIMVGNLISKNSVLAAMARSKGMHVSQVNILDKQGNVSWAAKWTREEVQQMADFMGYRSFQKEFMNNPITEGAVFRQEWIRWREPLPLSKYDYLVAYCDPSFKNSSKMTTRPSSCGARSEPSFIALRPSCGSAPSRRWCAGSTTCTSGRPKTSWSNITSRRISCRTSSSTSSRARASCADTSSPSAPTDARSPTSFSA